MIVIYHFTEIGEVDFGFIEGQPYNLNPGKILLGLCAAGVPIFFWTFGVTTIDKNYSLKSVCLKILNILKVYFIWGTIIYLIFNSLPPSPHNLLLGFKNNIVYFWFFRTLAILCVIQFIYVRLGRPNIVLYGLWTLIFIFPFCSNSFFDIVRICNPGSEIPAWGHSGFFTLYSIVYYFGCKVISKNIRTVWCILLIFLGFLLNTVVLYSNINATNTLPDNVNPMFPTLGAFLMTLGLCKLCKNKVNSKNVFQPFVFLGRYCLGIYIFHTPFIFLFLKIFPYHFSFLSAILLGILIAFICAAINLLLRRTPYLRTLVKI